MRYSRLTVISVCVVAAALVGAGCSKKAPEASQDNPGSRFAGLSATEITKQLNFKDGSSFVIASTAVKKNGAFEVTNDPSRSTRTVTLTQWNGETASFDWKLDQQLETEGSMQARDAQKDSPPEPVYETVTTEGTLTDLDFTKSHAMYLPIRWPEGKSGDRESAVWVSKPVFEELSRTRNSTVYLNVIPALLDAARNATGLAGAIEQFRQKENSVIERTDTDFMKVEGDLVDWPLLVNGERVNVKAMKARNWFGEIVVLNNYDNPLVLKLDVGPPVEGAEGASPEMNLLKAIASYEINSIQL